MGACLSRLQPMPPLMALQAPSWRGGAEYDLDELVEEEVLSTFLPLHSQARAEQDCPDSIIRVAGMLMVLSSNVMVEAARTLHAGLTTTHIEFVHGFSQVCGA